MPATDDAIEKTPEYENFMRRLKDFHDRKGTTLVAEPILGGKKLDLLRIYKTVIEAGGWEKVTQNRGWKQVGDPFNFPPTCTNSAFILKGVYMKNLVGWEEENYWKRPWNPPPDNVPQLSKDSSPKPNITTTRLPNNPNSGTVFLAPNHPRQPTTTQSPDLMNSEFLQRILLALQSALPNEIDWAFNELVIFSCHIPHHLDKTPTLVDSLIEFAKPFFEGHVQTEILSKQQDQYDPGYTVFCDIDIQELMERVLQVFHILRNFSILENNIGLLANHKELRRLLMISISLPPCSEHSELSRHCLDILENIATQVKVSYSEDSYLVAMTTLLYSNDRALILGAIRSLTRVAIKPDNEGILGLPNPPLVKRMSQFLLVDDEELLAAALDFLNQYSELPGEFAEQLVEEFPGNLIGLLTGYLSYKSSLMKASAPDLKSQPPAIPDLTHYDVLDEPYRCLGWVKHKLEKTKDTTSDNKILFHEVYSQYQMAFSNEKPLVAKEFFTVLDIAIPQPKIVKDAIANGPTYQPEVALQSVKYAPQLQEFQCHWKDCDNAFDAKPLLLQHIVEKHAQGMNVDRCYCGWKNCSRGSFTSKAALIKHLRIHFATKSKAIKRQRDFEIITLSTDTSEVSGVPLTAALLLRSLARHKQNHENYMPYEATLSLLAVQRPGLAKYIWSVFSSLQIN